MCVGIESYLACLILMVAFTLSSRSIMEEVFEESN
jgi:hypothetical protein